MLAGRAAQLRTLESALIEAIAGRGSLVVLSGEAGIGKSALVDALAASAETRAIRIERGRAWEFADAPPKLKRPYTYLISTLRSMGVDLGPKALKAMKTRQKRIARRSGQQGCMYHI